MRVLCRQQANLSTSINGHKRQLREIEVPKSLVPRCRPDVRRADDGEFEPHVNDGVRWAVRTDDGAHVVVHDAGRHNRNFHALHALRRYPGRCRAASRETAPFVHFAQSSGPNHSQPSQLRDPLDPGPLTNCARVAAIGPSIRKRPAIAVLT